MIVSSIRGILFLAFLTFLASCSPNSSSEPKLTITFPKASSMKAASKPATSIKNFNWDLACYIVNVTGPGINELNKNSCEIPMGRFKGSALPGGSITLDVDRGANRKIEVFAFMRSAASEPCPGLSGGFGSLNRLRVSLVGVKENISIQNDNETVAIDLAYPSVADVLATKYNLPSACLPTVDPDSVARITPARRLFSGTGVVADHSVSTSPSDFKAAGTNLMIRANIRRN